MLTLTEACNILRVDQGINDDLITSLCEAIPGYIELQTGMSVADQTDDELVKTVSGFILTLWYFSEHAEDLKLKRTIDNLLIALTIKVQRNASTKDKTE